MSDISVFAQIWSVEVDLVEYLIVLMVYCEEPEGDDSVSQLQVRQ